MTETDKPTVEQPGTIPQPWCETCGCAVVEVLCGKCGGWWRDNSPDAARIAALEAESAAVRKLLNVGYDRAVSSSPGYRTAILGETVRGALTLLGETT